MKFRKKRPRLGCVWKSCTFRSRHLNNYFKNNLLTNFSHTLDNLNSLGKLHSFFFQKQPFADNLQNRSLKNFAIFTGKHLYCSLFLITLQAFQICEIFNNNFFYKTYLVTASVLWAIAISALWRIYVLWTISILLTLLVIKWWDPLYCCFRKAVSNKLFQNVLLINFTLQ